MFFGLKDSLHAFGLARKTAGHWVPDRQSRHARLDAHQWEAERSLPVYSQLAGRDRKLKGVSFAI